MPAGPARFVDPMPDPHPFAHAAPSHRPRRARPVAPPAGERPRERLAQCGVAALTDAELLAVLIGTGAGRRSALEVAREALVRHGGLAGLVASDARQPTPGIGRVRRAQIAASVEIVRRAGREALSRGDVLTSPEAVRDYLRVLLLAHECEVFFALFLDSQHRLIAADELFRGTLAQTSVYPREVVKSALAHNAAAVIFAHNHPSGVAEPSRADELLTQALKAALALVDVRALDHFVVAGGAVVSFAERGLL
jgi:DNA repair protein RadC